MIFLKFLFIFGCFGYFCHFLKKKTKKKKKKKKKKKIIVTLFDD